ncbi:TIGR02391 family protein [Streptomyces albogriseolus]|uniref:TIGR02391 family protein n=1 Tax=Streptomyces albogriseolus TaxID=1887 RepID=UPI00345FB730
MGETDLCLQTFDLKEPVAGKPRLRFPGDRTIPTWRARQEGAKYLAAGVFLAIRNVAAHEDEVPWTEQEALEHIATLSVLACWIEECAVESAACARGARTRCGWRPSRSTSWVRKQVPAAAPGVSCPDRGCPGWSLDPQCEG